MRGFGRTVGDRGWSKVAGRDGGFWIQDLYARCNGLGNMDGLCGFVRLRAEKSVCVDVLRDGWPCDSLIGLGGEVYVSV